MTLTEFSTQLGVSEEALKRFMQEFQLDISECLHPDQQVTDDFIRFATEHKDFLQQYEADLLEKKTADEISEKIGKPVEEVSEELKTPANIFPNGRYRTSISSYGIDRNLGGDYQFIYNYFDDKRRHKQREFIGFRDLYFYATDILAPFTDTEMSAQWGIVRPAGILLYGPHGAGKIFWAKKIAEIIDYEFVEVNKTYITPYFDGGVRKDFRDYVAQIAKHKTLLFFEDLDKMLYRKTDDGSYNSEMVKDVLLQQMQKDLQEEVLIVGSCTFLNDVDEQLFAPGRLDEQIPVFPPNENERAEIVVKFLLDGLNDDSELLKILRWNGADKQAFWEDAAAEMKLFSVTMLRDFTQILKKRLRTRYYEIQSHEIEITEKVVRVFTADAAVKRTDAYLNEVSAFLKDATKNSGEDFPERIRALSEELDTFRAKEVPARKIGFSTDGEDDEKS